MGTQTATPAKWHHLEYVAQIFTGHKSLVKIDAKVEI